MNAPRPEATEEHVLYCGAQKCRPGHSYGPAVRDHYLLKYVKAGKGILRTGGRTFHVSPGEGFVLFPENLTYYEADRDDPWHYLWIAFNGETFAGYLASAGVTPGTPVVLFDDRRRIEELYRQLLRRRHFGGPAGEALRRGSLLLLFAEILQAAAPEPVRRDRSISRYEKNRIQEAVHLMTLRYAQDVSVAQIAREVGMDRSYFSRRFKETTGKSPRDYLLEYRLTRAASLLAETDIPVEDIALSTGFNTPLYFSRVFKKHAGCTPTAFRNRDTDQKRFVFSQA